jgi:4-hydroxy-tetrahydrodipicolinate reductase
MSSVLRVVSFGLGPIGLAAARLVLQKETLQLAGAVDVDPAKIGTDLGELLGSGDRLGIEVEGNAEAALARTRPDVVLHCTGSFLPDVKAPVLAAVRAGADVVSSAEELLMPEAGHPELASELHEAALAAGVSVLGTGVNPGFAMDFLAVVASAVTSDVRAVKCVRVVDAANRRQPLLKKIGAGLTKSEFHQQVATGRFGHVGIRQSVALLAKGLGMELDRTDQTVEPVFADEDLKTPFLTVKEGQVAGLRCHGYGHVGRQVVVHLDLAMYVGAPDPSDQIHLDATPPVQMKIAGGIPGDDATAAILVNSVHGLAASSPGLRTMLDVVPPRVCR